MVLSCHWIMTLKDVILYISNFSTVSVLDIINKFKDIEQEKINRNPVQPVP